MKFLLILSFLITNIVYANELEECEIYVDQVRLQKQNLSGSDLIGYDQHCAQHVTFKELKQELLRTQASTVSNNKASKKNLNIKVSNSSITSDTEAPQLVSLLITPFEINVSDGKKIVNVEISLRDESGINPSQSIEFKHSAQGIIKSPKYKSGDNWNYNISENTYDATFEFEFDETSVDGDWNLFSVFSLKDTLGNSVYLTPEMIRDLGFNPTLEIVNSNIVDTSPPELVSLTINPSTIDVSAGEVIVTLNISFSDESGINPLQSFWFRNSEYNLYKNPEYERGDRWLYNPTTDTYDATFEFVFDETAVAGDWDLSSVLGLRDSIGNRDDLYSNDIKNLGFNPTLKVVNTNVVDTAPPELVFLSIAPSKIDVTDGEKIVTVEVSLRDESGINPIQSFWFRNEEYSVYKSAEYERGEKWTYNATTNTYDAKFEYKFDELSVAGDWKLSALLNLRDSLGNSTYLYSSDISKLGFSPTLTVDKTVVMFDSKITVASEKSYIREAQKTVFLLDITESRDYTIDVELGSRAKIENIDFENANAIATSCSILYRTASCNLNAAGIDDFLTLVVNSTSRDLSEFSIKATLKPEYTEPESNWTNNEITYPDLDIDNDGLLNTEDTDIDNDGVSNDLDDFPFNEHESKDTDSDGIGNNNDDDDDGDGYSDTDELAADTNPLNAESIPADTDRDFIPDAIDTDIDNDGVENKLDAFPYDAAEHLDTDLDGIGNNADTDDDGDGYADTDELAAETDPLNAESIPTDSDGDFISDATDSDIDNDGAGNELDAFPYDATETLDTDLDGIGNNADTDDDGDGYSDTDELAAETDPLDAESIPTDTDGDFISDATDSDIDNDGVDNELDAFPYDATETLDTDLDGIGNNADTDDDGDGYSDTDELAAETDPLDAESIPADTDGDLISDATDSDIDNDGVDNELDAFPYDATETLDTDLDGIGNNADTDDDGDGYADTDELAADTDPIDAESIPADTDGDLISDATDSDIDNDGVDNEQDAFPYDDSESVDTDSDGIGNNADTDDDGDGYSDAEEKAAGSNPLSSSSIPSESESSPDNSEESSSSGGSMHVLSLIGFALILIRRKWNAFKSN